ncbi:hypothetical protein [Candidatus Enterococcus lemimoniae]|uniref:Uncharacterized protein n=1 Tax=Candidatus Enterococcus lemimoniae TaxID=1834167 RepID=A0ABZ2T727_9ENTE|nr:hypothetical protein [Enterococcus sp. 12C11_DIV0727]OTO70917.1 hypothetical protein A5866_003167 [Enterococcus sp. 12C11_DIV0727]
MAQNVDINISDIEDFGADLMDILETIEEACKEAQKIGNLKFYKEGQAKDAVSKLKDIPNKYASVAEHYGRLLQITALTWEQMSEMDTGISNGIQAAQK